MRAAAVQYRRFALVASLSGLLNSAVGNLPPLLLAVVLRGRRRRILRARSAGRLRAVRSLGNSIARVYISRVTRASNEAPGTLLGLLFRVTLRLPLSLPLFVILFHHGTVLFPLIFGQEWAEVGVYTQILCPALAFDFIFQTTSVLLPAPVRRADAGVGHLPPGGRPRRDAAAHRAGAPAPRPSRSTRSA